MQWVFFQVWYVLYSVLRYLFAYFTHHRNVLLVITNCFIVELAEVKSSFRFTFKAL